MTIDQFEMILDDLYLIDLYSPNSSFYAKDFKKASYTKAAVGELIKYVDEHLGHLNDACLKDYIWYVNEYEKLMNKFIKFNNPYTMHMFNVAKEVTANVKETLMAMK